MKDLNSFPLRTSYRAASAQQKETPAKTRLLRNLNRRLRISGASFGFCNSLEAPGVEILALPARASF